MSNIIDINRNKKTKTIPSTEVAKMMQKEHKEVMRMIDGYEPPEGSKKRKIVGIIPTLTKGNITPSDYFIENTYKDKSGKLNKCYECTKMGCELLANKLTGEKGILFSATYVKRFNEMESAQMQTIDTTELSPNLQSFKILFDSMVEQELKQKQMEKDIKGLQNSLDNIQDLISLSKDNWRADVKNMVNKITYKTGINHKVVYDEIYKEIDSRFGVNLNTRLKNRKNNAIKNGVSKTKADKINKLDIINEDKLLIEAILIVIKDLAIKYGLYEENDLTINM
jgi:phage regulator Rha-like protein